MTNEKKQVSEWINGLLLLILGGWIWWYATDFPKLEEGYPGPSLFPTIVAGGFILSGLLLLILQKDRKLPSFFIHNIPKQGALSLLAGLIAICLFPYLKEYLGFMISLGILCFCFGLLLKVKIWKAAITALATSIIIYGLFVIGLGLSL